MPTRFGPFVLDRDRRQLLERGAEVHLSPKAYDLLATLVEQRPRAVSKTDLQAKLWPDTFVQEANLGVLVSEVRAALHDGGRRGVYIRTVHGFGYAFAADARDEPTSAQGELPDSASLPAAVVRKRPGWRLAVAAASLLAVVALAAWFTWPRGSTPSPSVSRRLNIVLRPDMPLAPAGLVSPAHDRPALALSSDASRLAYVGLVGGRTYLCVLDLVTGNTTRLEQTEGGHTPFFSPDGAWIGFFANHKLKKVAATGGPAIPLADAPYPWGAVWGPDDTISFNRKEAEGIFAVPAGGGPIRAVVEGLANMPDLVGKDGLLVSGFATRVRYVDRRSPASFKVLVDGGHARYLPSGHLVYESETKLLAVAFDVSRVETVGAPVMLADGVRTANYAVAQFAVTDDGFLVYAPGRSQGMTSFVWVDRDGATAPFGLPEADYGAYALDRDGRRLAYSLVGEIYVYDPLRDGANREGRRISPRVSTGLAPRNNYPRWTPDGRNVIYLERPGSGSVRLVMVPAEGSTAEPIELWRADKRGPSYLYPMQVSRDGSTLSVFGPSPGTSQDLFTMPGPVAGGARPRARQQLFMGGDFSQEFGQISPDGLWMLFGSDKEGTGEIYVTSYPKPGRIVRVSPNGGREPMWNPAAPEIVYLNGTSMYAASVEFGDEIRIGEPRRLFAGAFPDVPGFGYDMSGDGRFLMLENKDILKPVTTLNVIENVVDEMRRRATPTAGRAGKRR